MTAVVLGISPARDADPGELWRDPRGFGLGFAGRLVLGLRDSAPA